MKGYNSTTLSRISISITLDNPKDMFFIGSIPYESITFCLIVSPRTYLGETLLNSSK